MWCESVSHGEPIGYGLGDPDRSDTDHEARESLIRRSAPKFTIVIPTKQEEDYILATLRHYRGEEARHNVQVEIVVVDGGSTDRTVDLARTLADNVVTDDTRASESIAAARNIGADRAMGQFILHTDADVIVPNLGSLLERCLSKFDETGNVVAITTAVMPYPWDSDIRDYVIHRIANLFFRTSLWYGALFSRGECQIVRRSSFDAVGGYDTRYISGEDCDLFRRMNRIGRIVYLDDLCVFHSVRRFRAAGYIRVFGIYLREWLTMNLLKHSYLSEWPVVR